MSHFLIICDTEPVPVDRDVKKLRAVMLSENLVERGHKVTFLRTTFDHKKKKRYFSKDETKVVGGVKYVFLNCLAYKKNFSVGRVLHYLVFGYRLSKFLKSSKTVYDVVIASYPCIEAGFVATRFCKKAQIPILIDVRDKWPDSFSSYFNGIYSRMVPMVCGPYNWMKNYIFSNSDSITSMSQYMLDWVHCSRKNKISNDKVFHLGTSLDLLDIITHPSKQTSKSGNNKLVCTYVGGIIHSYDLNTVLKASLACDFISVNIVGDGPLLNNLKSLPRGEQVNFMGWASASKVSKYLLESDILLFPVDSRIMPNMPNKLFDYLWAGKPILASVHGEAKNLIRDNDLGYVFKHGDVDDFICGLHYLSDTDVRERISKNISRIFQERFTTKKIYDGFSQYVEGLVQKK